MGKFESFMEKIGIGYAEDDQDDNETYTQSKSKPAATAPVEKRNSSFSAIHSNRGKSDVRLTSEPVQEEVVSSYRSSRRKEEEKNAAAELSAQPGNSKVLNLHASVQMEVVVSSPESFEEAMAISDDLKNNKPVVINLEFVEHPIAQRITDFLCGACYALGGNIQQIADKIYMIAPGNVDIAASPDFRKTLQNVGGLTLPLGSE